MSSMERASAGRAEIGPFAMRLVPGAENPAPATLDRHGGAPARRSCARIRGFRTWLTGTVIAKQP